MSLAIDKRCCQTMCVVLIATLLLTLSGGCLLPRNVTYDKEFGFASMAGQCYVLKREVALLASGALVSGDEARMLLREGQQNPRPASYYEPKDVLGMVPSGTRIRLEKLVNDPNSFHVSARILDGEFRNRVVYVRSLVKCYMAEVIKWDCAKRSSRKENAM